MILRNIVKKNRINQFSVSHFYGSGTSDQKHLNVLFSDIYFVSQISQPPKLQRNGSVFKICVWISVFRRKKYCKAEYVQRRVCFVNVQSSLHENVVFSVCVRMDNAAYIIFIMWNSISGLDAWYHFWFNISCGVAVKGKGHRKKFR